MAKPVPTNIRAVDDAAASGKRIEAQSEVNGSGDTVFAQRFVLRSREKILGRFRFALPLQSVVTSAHDGTTTGFAWLQVPIGATVRARLRRLHLAFTAVTTGAMLTAPRIVLARFAFTGTASGATVDPGKLKSDEAANVMTVRTAVTGMTVTVGAAMFSAPAPATLTGVGTAPSAPHAFEPQDEDGWIDLAAGEGLLLYQPDAGTASDSRRFTVHGAWDEVDNA